MVICERFWFKELYRTWSIVEENQENDAPSCPLSCNFDLYKYHDSLKE